MRPVQPLFFPEQEPEEERLGQGQKHLSRCFMLFEILRRACGAEHSVVSDMFVYWNATSSKLCRAPDAAIKLGLPSAITADTLSWKTWELGVPEVVVEVLSASDTRERWTLTEKRDAYAEMGVDEFVCFDFDAPEGKRLRVWDRIDGDFVERVVEGETSPSIPLSEVLGATIAWTIAPGDALIAAPRVLRDGALVPLAVEVAAEEKARADAAEARLAELEAQLARR